MAAATQKSIAKRLGINPITVAHALNNHPRVAAKTRERVHNMAAELGYSPNRAAQALRGGRTGIIGLVTPESDDSSVLFAPYFEAIMRGITSEAANRDLSILMCPSKPGSVPGIVRAGGVDGVLAFVAANEVTELLIQIDRPIIGIGSLWGSDSVTTLVPDQAAGMALVTMHLRNLGHRRIAYLGYGLNFPDSIVRYESYRAVMLDAGLFDEHLVNTCISNRQEEFVGPEVCRLWEKSGGFTALVCYQDDLAMTGIRTLEGMGLGVPADVSVTGFDDISSAFHFSPAISSVRFDRVEMGRLAVRMIDGDCERKGELFPVYFEARASTRALSSALSS